uniref:Uncharacterized protein n=1 Tax=viral metagenome TaxID=1070528 RepID=A0A6C0IZU6_9ZZZZ
MPDTECANGHIQEAHDKAEQASLEKDMRDLLAVRKPTAKQNSEYRKLKARHVAVLEKQAGGDRACVEPVSSPWPGASMLKPAPPDKTDVPRKVASTLFDDEDDGDEDEKEPMLPEFTSSAVFARAKGYMHRLVGWRLPRRSRPSCRPIVYTTVYAHPPPCPATAPQPDQSAH